LDSWWKAFISSFLSLLGRMHNYCLLLLIWFPFVVPEPSSCNLCMYTTWTGNVVTRTLLFRIYYSCAGSVIGLWTHNHTSYLVCTHDNQHICFNLTYNPQEQWLVIRSIRNPGNFVSRTQVFSPDKPVSILFNARAAIDQDGYGGIGYGCGDLIWERAYTSNEKYMCRRDNSWPGDDVGSYYCRYWTCVSWATWERTKHAALLHKLHSWYL
jgi:hypothetical protein